MRKLIILSVTAFLLFGCAGQKYYQSKGVYYPKQSAGELSAMHKFNLTPLPNSDYNTYSFEGTASSEKYIYCPVRTSYQVGDSTFSFVTIYQINKQDLSVTDSLVLKSPANNLTDTHLVLADSLMIISKADTLFQIVTADKHLHLGQTYPTLIKNGDLLYAGMSGAKLRLVIKSPDAQIFMYDFHTNGMAFERKRLLLKDASNMLSCQLTGGWFWLFRGGKSSLETVRFAIQAIDPSPIFNDINYPVQDTTAVFQVCGIADSTIYISYSAKVANPKAKSGFDDVHRLYVVNSKNSKVENQIDYNYLGFNLLPKGDKLYLYTAVVSDRIRYKLAEISPDLKLERELVSFTIDDFSHYSASANPANCLFFKDNDNFYFTGEYFQKLGTLDKMTYKTVTNAGKFALQPQLFLAAYPLP